MDAGADDGGGADAAGQERRDGAMADLCADWRSVVPELEDGDGDAGTARPWPCPVPDPPPADGVVECEDGTRYALFEGVSAQPAELNADACIEPYGDPTVEDCTADADCTAGPAGHCLQRAWNGATEPCGCVYTCRCAAECPMGQACVQGQCTPGSCRSNADCGAYACVETYEWPWPTLQCQSSSDACRRNSECATGLDDCDACSYLGEDRGFGCVGVCGD